RVGGEEFLLILSHGEKNNIEIAIDRIRELLEQQEFHFSTNSVRVTASFGIAEFTTAHSADFTKLVAEADAALYLAKEKGRNRIEFREEVPQRSNLTSAATSAL